MPRRRPWTGRLEQILNDLYHMEKRWLSRKDIMQLFQITRSPADRLMKDVGKETSQGESVVDREIVLVWLTRSPEAVAFWKEQERRRAVAKKLSDARADLKFHAVVIPDAKPQDEWTEFADLRQIHLEPGRMVIDYRDKGDLLTTLWRLSKALVNDWEQFEKMVS